MGKAGRKERVRTQAALSPSLAAAGGTAYEVKFVIGEKEAADVEKWAREAMRPDPHGDGARGYEVTTLYLDTPRFDVFHRARELRGAKYRLRRYGSSSEVYLERKIRKGSRVQKQRVSIPESELARVAGPAREAAWEGDWFRDEIAARTFGPVCRLTYRRIAFFGEGSSGPFRLTLDRDVRSEKTDAWALPAVNGSGRRICEGLVVCEMKFREAMPTEFKRLVALLTLVPARLSKYRRACTAEGLVRRKGARRG